MQNLFNAKCGIVFVFFIIRFSFPFCRMKKEEKEWYFSFLFPLSFFLFYLAHTWYSPGLSFEGSFFALASKMLVMPSIEGASPVYFTFCALPF